MSNAVEEFLQALKRTINGDPYPAAAKARYAPVRYRVVNLRDPLHNQVLAGKYRIESRIGKGAMATVYKAIQDPIDRVVAVKILNHGYSNDPIAIKRFKLEAKTLSSLRHRNVLSVHDLGNTDKGQPFFVMEYLDGISLEKLIEKRGPIPVARAVPIFAQICDGMSYAHSEGVVHRDLKPANVMLVRDDNDEIVKLVDFGIVKVNRKSQLISQQLTKKGEVWGSPVYMSPEQCMGNELDARSDVYSLGLLMYESLLGIVPFDGPNIAQIISAQLGKEAPHFKDAVPSLRIPEILEKIVFRALEKKPEDRFASMAELKEALEAFAGPYGIRLRKVTGPTSKAEAGLENVEFGQAQRNRLEQSKVTTQAPVADDPAKNVIPIVEGKNSGTTDKAPVANANAAVEVTRTEAAQPHAQSQSPPQPAATPYFTYDPLKFTKEHPIEKPTHELKKPKIDSMLFALIILGIVVIMAVIAFELFFASEGVEKPPVDTDTNTSTSTSTGTSTDSNSSNTSAENKESSSAENKGSGSDESKGSSSGENKTAPAASKDSRSGENKTVLDKSKGSPSAENNGPDPAEKIGSKQSKVSKSSNGNEISPANETQTESPQSTHKPSKIHKLIKEIKNRFKNRDAKPPAESDEALLERIHLRKKHNRDSTQQWLDVQEKEKQ